MLIFILLSLLAVSFAAKGRLYICLYRFYVLKSFLSFLFLTFFFIVKIVTLRMANAAGETMVAVP